MQGRYSTRPAFKALASIPSREELLAPDAQRGPGKFVRTLAALRDEREKQSA
jgi:hypothetical protein